MGEVLTVIAVLLFLAGWIALETFFHLLVSEIVDAPKLIREWREDRKHRVLEEQVLLREPRTSLLRASEAAVEESAVLLRVGSSVGAESGSRLLRSARLSKVE